MAKEAKKATSPKGEKGGTAKKSATGKGCRARKKS